MKTSTQQLRTCKRIKNIFKITNALENQLTLDNDYLLEERLEEKLLMKKLKETNIDSPVGITDVVEIMLDKPVDELTDEELRELVKPSRPKGRPKKEENFEWVYRLLDTHGRVFVNLETFKKLDEKRLGNYSLDFLKKSAADEKDGYIIWRV
mgnify:CR=1 FL=1